MRKTIVAGQFYPSDEKELKEKIKNFLADAEKTIKVKVYGIISPHAGYEYSGKTAAISYKTIEKESFDTAIILGPNHIGYGKKIAVTNEDFETPLGVAEVDNEFCEEIIKKYGKSLEGHKYEHCIEVQLPFLIYLFKKVKIVPIVLSLDNYSECSEFANVLMEIAKKFKRKVIVIASSDFTHYGYAYSFMPFSGSEEEVKKKLYELDRKAISFIEKLDAKKFFEYSKKTTICGASAITTAIELCKKLGAKKAKLLKYCTSGDISSDYSNAVGYASIVFV